MTRKQKIIVSITGIVLVSLILIGLTYAYFLTVITGNTNTKSISVTTANLSLTYSDGNDVITGDKILPGTTLTQKTFTVTNNGNKNIDSYKVGLVNVVNTFTRTGDIVYTLTCKSSITNKKCNGVTEKEFPNLNSYIVENEIDKDEVQTYTLTITYKEMGVDQSDDMNKELSAKIDIFSSINTIELSGNVTGNSEGDYVVINSKEQTSEIVNGKYKFIGIEPDNHTISIKNKSTSKNLTDKLSIIKGKSQSYTNDIITMDDSSKKAEMNIAISDNSITKIVKDVNDGISKREYLVYVATFEAASDYGFQKCFSDGNYKCKGPYNIVVYDNMTINDWVSSSYADELKSEGTILTGDQLKGKTLGGGYCGTEMNNAISSYYYHVDTSRFGFIKFINATEIVGSNSYSPGGLSISYPDNKTKINEVFTDDTKVLVLTNTSSCWACLPPDTLIEVEEEDEKGKKKRKKKKIKDIKIGDKVICIDPITHELTTDIVVEYDGDKIKKHNEYDNWIFNDGTVLTTVHRHRFYNVEKQEFTYMDEWKIGEHGYNINCEKIKLIEHQHIEDEIEHCTLFTEKYNNYFANNMLCGNRNSNKINL